MPTHADRVSLVASLALNLVAIPFASATAPVQDVAQDERDGEARHVFEPQAMVVDDNFERDIAGDRPQGWITPPAGNMAGSTTMVVNVDDADPTAGQCVEIALPELIGPGNIMKTIDATSLRNQGFRVRAKIRYEGSGRAQLWVRVDRGEPDSGAMGFFDNMFDRPIREGDWAEYETLGDVAEDAHSIAYGLLVYGPGRAWLDDVRIEPLGAAVFGPPDALTPQELENAVAFTRLFGDVRHFHPSDEGEHADWVAVAREGMYLALGAEDAVSLATRLAAAVHDVAPTVRIEAGPLAPTPAPFANDAKSYTFWNHHGAGQMATGATIYRSGRVRQFIDRRGEKEPEPGEHTIRELTPGVWSAVPLTLALLDDHTPRGEDRDFDLPEGSRLPEILFVSPRDRTTRLASVAIAWNVLQHFYPYFDVVETDWDAALRVALESAATDASPAAFRDTLRRLIAGLHDGHGGVNFMAAEPEYRLPFEASWIEGELVVTQAVRLQGVGPKAGDRVLKIDGRDPTDIRAELEPLISAATSGWLDKRVADMIVQRETRAPAFLDMKRPDGSLFTARTPCPSVMEVTFGYERSALARLRGDIWYCNLGRIDDGTFLNALPDLVNAKGVIFDLRGYPGSLSTIVIAHLIEEPVTSAQWHIPIVRWPDRKNFDFISSNWSVQPAEPRITAPVAFLTGGGAISYAETYMSIIDHYDIAPIVGATTAGTNGNVHRFTLPGGYSVTWTGMKVLRHDGTQYHGIGVQPTHPATQTIAGLAAGRDDVLERAIEVVSEGRE